MVHKVKKETRGEKIKFTVAKFIPFAFQRDMLGIPRRGEEDLPRYGFVMKGKRGFYVGNMREDHKYILRRVTGEE
jgi:hypothetical protein